MKYIRELLIIILISFIGEILSEYVPLPIPACVYGMAILFICLATHIIKLENIKATSKFLIEIMPLMFIPAGVKMMESFTDLKPMILSVSVITVITTVLVMVSTGLVTELVAKHEEKAKLKEIKEVGLKENNEASLSNITEASKK